MEKCFTCKDGSRIKVIDDGSFPVLTISKIPKKGKFYAELGTGIAYSPNTKRSALTMAQLLGKEVVDNVGTAPTKIGNIARSFIAGCKATQTRKFSGEEKSFVLYEAESDDAKFTLRSCFPGSLFVYDLNDSDLIAVSDSFFAANFSAKYGVFSTGDLNIRKFSETNDLFQHFYGEGYVVLEVHGAFVEVPLYSGEKIQVAPGQLLAVTQQKIGENMSLENQTVKMEMVSAGDINLRKLENRDYFIELTAPGEVSDDPNQPVVAKVWISSVKSDDFFKGFRENLMKEVKTLIKKSTASTAN
jgi:uncharacterized protein (AIM24 family)